MSRGGIDEETTLSPKSRLKFLCSYGGKILPRPSDGQLKYMGGETRALSVPHFITFKELKDKISGMFNNPDIVIKYQVYPEDLDTLVSVRSDEDLVHMIEEYDRNETLPRSPTSSSPSRFHIYLFPNSINHPFTPSSNSPTSTKGSMNMPNSSKPPLFNIAASPCSSPPSNIDSSVNGFGLPGLKLSGLGMHRVRSTPNLGENSNSSTIGSPRGNPQNQPQPQPQPQRAMAYGGGGPRSRVGASYRYETCGCGRVIPVIRNQRRYNHHCRPSFGGSPCHRGYMEECHTPTNSSNSRRRSIWE